MEMANSIRISRTKAVFFITGVEQLSSTILKMKFIYWRFKDRYIYYLIMITYKIKQPKEKPQRKMSHSNVLKTKTTR